MRCYLIGPQTAWLGKRLQIMRTVGLLGWFVLILYSNGMPGHFVVDSERFQSHWCQFPFTNRTPGPAADGLELEFAHILDVFD